MRYLDTNVLVRIITGDDPAIAQKALEEITRGAKDSYCIHDSVIVELCFVLEFHNYAMKRKDIAEALLTLAAAPQIALADNSHEAVLLYQQHPKLDYTDCLLYALGGKAGVMTYDKELQKLLNAV